MKKTIKTIKQWLCLHSYKEVVKYTEEGKETEKTCIHCGKNFTHVFPLENHPNRFNINFDAVIDGGSWVDFDDPHNQKQFAKIVERFRTDREGRK